jgi:hypothetical protein
MIQQLIVGFATEGNTDNRFLESVIQRTVEWLTFYECAGQIEVLPLISLSKERGAFTEVVDQYSRKAFESGVMILCIHTDADANTDENAFRHKITPAFEQVMAQNEEVHCKNLVAIVPVKMTEAWMLADIELLKQQLGSNHRDLDLGIHSTPDDYANPKAAIKEAIRLALENVSPRRRDLAISELYTPIGQKIALAKLRKLKSFCKFEEAVRVGLRKLHYLH